MFANMPPDVSRETLAIPGVIVSRETEQRLGVYRDLLQRWGQTINLVSAQDLAQPWPRHFADSLQIQALLPPVSRAIDLGSGAGFPGLVLAIATGIPFDLVEADHRKAAFLREAARITEAPVHVHAARIETLTLPPARLVTARALAPLDALLGLAARFIAPDGVALFPKGRTAQNELTEARRRWHMRVDQVPSATEPDACILAIREPRRIALAP